MNMTQSYTLPRHEENSTLSGLRLMVLDDLLVSKLNSLGDHDLIRALVILTTKRIENFIETGPVGIDFFMPNYEDKVFRDRCNKRPLDQSTFERAAKVMSELDATEIEWSLPSIDEVFQAVRNHAGRFFMKWGM
jgi:hypothetical protein